MDLLNFRMITRHILENLTEDEKDLIATAEILKLIIDEGSKYDNDEMVNYKYNKKVLRKTIRNVSDFKRLVANLFIKLSNSEEKTVILYNSLKDIVNIYCKEELKFMDCDIADREFVKNYLEK